MDIIACCAPIGIFLGRLSNFINSELWGKPTLVPWGIVFPNGGIEPKDTLVRFMKPYLKV